MIRRLLPLLPLILAPAATLCAADSAAPAWWNPAWSQRQTLTIDPAATGASGPLGPAAVLVRLHEGNFNFLAAAEGGADLRFIAPDGKTVLPHQVEKFDSLVNEAFVWVKLPDNAPAGPIALQLYSGSTDTAGAPKAAETYDAAAQGVYHFANGADATAHARTFTGTPSLAEGSLIGGGLRLLGGEPLTLADLPAWPAGQPLTVSAWVKPASLQPGAVLFSRGSGAALLRVLLDQGVPVVELAGGSAPARSAPGAPLAAGVWSHLALVVEGGAVKVFVNGQNYATLPSSTPALAGPFVLGGLPADAPAAGTQRFLGELDELQLADTARSQAWLQFAAASQGTGEAAAKAVALGAPEAAGGKAGGHSAALEHVMLFGDIAKNMMFDGWIAIGICILMISVGWTVAARKFFYLNSTQKGTREFLRQWKQLSSDLTAIDHSDVGSVRSFGGQADARAQSLIQRSPLYQIYHIGSEEIRHRLARDKQRTQGLSGRSIQAIRAALDGGLVHETHRLTKGLVFLTISIAGGPYVGLLGTVVGVMITFAIIAKSGEVDVNSIAPGIASALLATVAGLIVAIPALFIYSYLNSRIKETTSGMQVFIDEFVAKMAEFYPPAGEVSPYAVSSAESERPVSHS